MPAMQSFTLKLVLLVATAGRFAMLASAWNAPWRLETPDSKGYVELADNLRAHAAFQRNGTAEIFRTPGYPMFLLLGAPFGRAGWRVAMIAQATMDVALVYLTFLLGTLICNRRVGLYAAVFQALSPVAAAASVRILSDSVFAFLLTLTVLLVVHHIKTGRWWSVLSAGLVAAMACYVRPVGLLCCAVVAVVLLARHGGGWKRSGAFAGVVLALLGPWLVRNFVVADYLGMSSFAGDSMYYFSAAEVLARVDNIDVASERWRLRSEDRAATDLADESLTSGQAARRRRDRALGIILAHPLTYAKVHLRGSVGFLLPGITDVMEVTGLTAGGKGTLDVLHRRGLWPAIRHYVAGGSWAIWLCAPAVILLVAKYALCLVAVVSGAVKSMASAGWLMGLLILALALAGGPAATARFRVPVVPLLSVIASCGLVLLIDRFRTRPAGDRQRA